MVSSEHKGMVVFESVKLGELLEVLTDYHANGAYKKLKENVELLDEPDYAIMIRTTNFEQDNFTTSLKFITENAYNFLSKSKVYPDDIIMNKIANAGSCYFMPDLKVPVSLAMNLFLLRVVTEKVNPTYLYLYLKLNEKYVKSFANGSVTKTITKDAVRNLEIKLPKRKIQNEIAAVYLTLINKIELNRQMNQTLEAMAQALFKSWFVDFDPVLDNALAAGNPIPDLFAARAERRQQQNVTSDIQEQADHQPINHLFPDGFEYSNEMGWIPQGWEVGIISDMFELHRGFDLATKKRISGQVPVYSAGGIHGNHNEYKIEAPGIITGRSGVIGNVFLSLTPFWPLNTTLYVRKFRKSGPYYVLQFLKNIDLKVYNSGSAVPSLNRNFVHSTPSFIPTDKILTLYELHCECYFSKIKANEIQNDTLSKLRDTLLPKLLSGELRIHDAENLIKEIEGK